MSYHFTEPVYFHSHFEILGDNFPFVFSISSLSYPRELFDNLNFPCGLFICGETGLERAQVHPEMSVWLDGTFVPSQTWNTLSPSGSLKKMKCKISRERGAVVIKYEIFVNVHRARVQSLQMGP